MGVSVSIIIPACNCWSLTAQCLRSLAEGGDVETLEVIVVDNASSDATPHECPALGDALFPGHFLYLRQSENRNFAPACNIGARAARGNHLFFLNNDTRVTPGWLPPLQQTMEEDESPPCGMAGPTLLYPEFFGYPDRVQHIGITFEPQYYPAHLFEGFPAAHPAVNQRRAYQALTGAALFVPRALFLKLGLFDENFINGGEDVEFGLRLGKDGYTAVHVPASVIYHLASQTAGRHYYEEYNARLLREKAQNLIVPDLHLLAARHGYVLALGPRLRVYLDLPDKRQKLLARHSLHSLIEMEKFLLREPLWHEGYQRLHDARLALGDTHGAAQALGLAFKLRPDPDCPLHMLRLAKQGSSAANLADAMNLLRWLAETPFEPVRDLAASMAKLYGQVEKESDQTPTLSALYRSWLARADEFQRDRFGPATPYALAVAGHEGKE